MDPTSNNFRNTIPPSEPKNNQTFAKKFLNVLQILFHYTTFPIRFIAKLVTKKSSTDVKTDSKAKETLNTFQKGQPDEKRENKTSSETSKPQVNPSETPKPSEPSNSYGAPKQPETSISNQDDKGLQSGDVKSKEDVKPAIDKVKEPDPVDKEGKSELHHAIEKGDVEKTIELIDNGFDVNLVDNKGNTPIFYALFYSNNGQVDKKKDNQTKIQLVTKLLSNRANVNVQDKNGFTPLHIALASKNEQLISIIYDKTTDFNLLDKFGRSVFFAAVQSGDEAWATTIFFKNPDNFKSGELNTRNYRTHVLHEICKKGFVKFLKSAKSYFKEEDFFVRDSMNVSICDPSSYYSKRGYPPQHYACKNGNKDLVFYLKTLGVWFKGLPTREYPPEIKSMLNINGN